MGYDRSMASMRMLINHDRAIKCLNKVPTASNVLAYIPHLVCMGNYMVHVLIHAIDFKIQKKIMHKIGNDLWVVNFMS